MKIRQKLLLGFILIALLIVIVGFVSVYTGRAILQKSIGQNSVILVENIMRDIDVRVYSRIEDLQVYSGHLVLQEAVKKSNREFDLMSNRRKYITDKEEAWGSVPKRTITPFMQHLINNKLSRELKEKVDFYKEKYGYDVFGEIFVTNKYGVNVAQSGKTSDYYQADEEWWQKAKQKGLYLGGVKYDESAGIYSIALCIRVDDENKKFLGVMKAVLNVAGVINIIKNIVAEARKSHEILEFKLLTKDNGIIYSTEKFKIFQKMPGHIMSHFEQSVKHKHKHKDYFITKGDIPGEGTALFAHAHSSGYNGYKGLGWRLVIEQKTKDIFAPIALLRNIIFIISVALLVIAIIMGLLIADSISKPLIKLKLAAAEIGKGHLDVEIPINSKDEIGDLAKSFANMTNDLTASLEQEKKSAVAAATAMADKEKVEELAALNEELEATNEELRQTNEELESATEELRVANEVTIKAKEALESKTEKLEKFNQLTVDRELKMKELKAKIKDLEEK